MNNLCGEEQCYKLPTSNLNNRLCQQLSFSFAILNNILGIATFFLTVDMNINVLTYGHIYTFMTLKVYYRASIQ